MAKGKDQKNPNETRKAKVAGEGSANVNTTVDTVKLKEEADAKAAAELADRAKAVGLKKGATLDEVMAAEAEAAKKANITENDRQKELKAKNPKLWALQNTINQAFAEREKTNLPKHTETEIRELAGKSGASVDMTFVYTNDEKTIGHIDIKEFDNEVRCPVQGEFNFGVDYAAATKAMAEKTA